MAVTLLCPSLITDQFHFHDHPKTTVSKAASAPWLRGRSSLAQLGFESKPQARSGLESSSPSGRGRPSDNDLKRGNGRPRRPEYKALALHLGALEERAMFKRSAIAAAAFGLLATFPTASSGATIGQTRSNPLAYDGQLIDVRCTVERLENYRLDR